MASTRICRASRTRVFPDPSAWSNHLATASSLLTFLTDQDRNEAILVGRRDLGVIYFYDRDRQRVERRLVGRLERLGFVVSLEPSPSLQPAA